MKRFLALILSYTIFFNLSAQDLSHYNHLVGKVWKAEGKWGNGQPFKQEVIHSFSLDKKIVKVKSIGFTNQEATSYGLRNHGIRYYNSQDSSFEFTEYDVFGGKTVGNIEFAEKDFMYHYVYGESMVTDQWKYVDDDTYAFTVGIRKGDEWTAKFLETEFHSTLLSSAEIALGVLKDRIIGRWISKAWDGLQQEEWWIDEDGTSLLQESSYSEAGKILFEAKNKIEVIDDQLILISVIKDGNPKIFQMTSFDGSVVVFENNEYKNPSKVSYQLNEDGFLRTIEGLENNKPSSYTFNFSIDEK